MPAFSGNLTGRLPFHPGLERNETASFLKNATINDHV